MSINTAVRVTDGLTPAFKSMVTAINLTISSFEHLRRAANVDADINTASLRQARIEMNSANEAIQRLEAEMQDLDNQTRQYGNTSRSTFGGLVSTVRGLVTSYAALSAGRYLINTSDQYSQIQARLGLIVDEQQKVSDLNGMIFATAERARGSYADMAATVTRLRMNAPDAFGSSQEAIRFAELLNKQFKLSGANLEETRAATLQLTQALGSGLLRGDELNSVFESAPTIMQDLADYLGVGTGELRKMAEEGQLTADAVKNSMLRAGNEIDKKFDKLPMTWADRWQQAQNRVMYGLADTSVALNNLANSPAMDLFMDNISSITSAIAYMLAYIVTGIAGMIGFMAEYWNILGPPLLTVLGLLGLYKAELIITQGLEVASGVAKGIMAARTWATTNATWAQVAAQYGLNAALYACPLTWIVAGIMLVIGALFLLVGIINQVAGTNYSAIGIMAGAWNAFGAILYNIFLFILQTAMFVMMSILAAILWAVEGGANAFIDFYNTWVQVAEDVMNLAQTVGTAIGNAIIAGINLAISGINLLIDALNKIPGFNIGKVSKMAYESVPKYSFASRKMDYLNFGDIDPSKAFSGGYKDIGAAWDSGYNWGANLFNDNTSDELDKYQDMLDKYNNTYNPTGTGLSDGGVGNAVKDTAQNTEDIKNLLKVTGDNVEYLRDLAEREVINRFTTAEIKIDMTNNNSISSNMDIDGVVNTLVEQLEEAMATSAEGVHY